MSNLKEVWTQRICTDWTQPKVRLLSTTVSVTIKSLQALQCRHVKFDLPFIIIASFSTWTELMRHSKPFAERYWSAAKVKKKQKQNFVLHQHPRCDTTSFENCEESAVCPRWTAIGAFSVYIIEFPGNMKIKHKCIKSSI